MRRKRNSQRIVRERRSTSVPPLAKHHSTRILRSTFTHRSLSGPDSSPTAMTLGNPISDGLHTLRHLSSFFQIEDPEELRGVYLDASSTRARSEGKGRLSRGQVHFLQA